MIEDLNHQFKKKLEMENKEYQTKKYMI